MHRSRLVPVLGCAMLLACAQELTMRERAVLQEAVEDRLTGWVTALNNAKIDSILGFYHESAELRMLWPDGRRAEGWEATQESIRSFYAGIDFMNFVMQNPHVQMLSPSVAVSTFRHSTDIVIQTMRQPVVSGQGTIIWVRDSGDDLWKIHTAQISTNAPPLPIPQG